MVLGNNSHSLVERLHSPYGKLLGIEVLLCFIGVLLAILVFFGSFRRRSHSSVLKSFVWIAHTLSVSLIAYTMGQMQWAPFENELFTVWAVFLLLVLGSADSFSAFSLQDHEQRKRYYWEVLLQQFWIFLLISKYRLKTSFLIPLYGLLVLSMAKTGERLKAYELASRSSGLLRNSKLVADFMSYEHECCEEDEVDPVNMKGYNYLVMGEGEADVKIKVPRYQKRLQMTDKVITIHKIWQCKGRLLSRTGDPDGRLKDICLSFALFKLLCRRFAGYQLAESGSEKTWNFVRRGLLANEDDHERVFRVVEVELAFLFDFFYTKYPAIFSDGSFIVRAFVILCILILSCWMALSVLYRYQPSKQYLNLVTSSGHNIDVWITTIVIAAVGVLEISQLFIILFSNWAKVVFLCKYVEKTSSQKSRSKEKWLKFICSPRRKWCFKPWERKLGQYALFKRFKYSPSDLLYNNYVSKFIDRPREGQKEIARITLSEEVKRAVIRSLKTNGPNLTNGEASLRRNRVADNLSWACRVETHTHRIMVWHIATSLCEMAASERAPRGEEEEEDNFLVATSLSKYCAYLVAFAPSLLPDHVYVSEFIFDQVIIETRDLLKGCDSMESMREKMINVSDEDPEETIIKGGAKLGKKLMREIESPELRWKVLADVWAEMMLFVTPSDNVTAHAEYLATGGEFITHLWALLSHAGILEQNPVTLDA